MAISCMADGNSLVGNRDMLKSLSDATVLVKCFADAMSEQKPTRVQARRSAARSEIVFG